MSTVRKRTYNLDGELIGRARRVLDAKTDTEAIQRAHVTFPIWVTIQPEATF